MATYRPHKPHAGVIKSWQRLALHVSGPFSGDLLNSSGFHSYPANNPDLGCFLCRSPGQAVEQTVRLLVIWDVLTHMCTCDVTQVESRNNYYWGTRIQLEGICWLTDFLIMMWSCPITQMCLWYNFWIEMKMMINCITCFKYCFTFIFMEEFEEVNAALTTNLSY